MRSLTVKRPNIRAIISLVLVVHGLLALSIAWDPVLPTRSIAPRRPVVVRVVALAESRPVVVAPVAEKPVPPPVPKPPAKAQKKPTPTKPPTPTKSQAKPKPTASVTSARTAALEKARASLAKLQHVAEGSVVSTESIDLVVPDLSAAPMAAVEVAVMPPYSEELTTRLKTLLKLPEYGSVKVQLTLKRLGFVNRVEILQAESQVNRTYVEKELPALKFADFGKFFPGEEEHSFTLVLSNDLY